jgi:cyclic-di-AMP phosphodiesterase PgpH
MTIGGQKRTRSERVAALELPPGQWERAWISLGRRDVLGRIFLAFLAAAGMCAVIRAWDPPFVFRTRTAPQRDIVARMPFSQEDPVATLAARQMAQNLVPNVYSQNPVPLEQLRNSLRNVIVVMTAAENLADADKNVRNLWNEFQLPQEDIAPLPSATSEEAQFHDFRAPLAGPENLDQFEKMLAAVFAPFEKSGLLSEPAKAGVGNQEEISVYLPAKPDELQTVKLADVLIGDGAVLHQRLRSYFVSQTYVTGSVADRLFTWLRPKLMSTLTLDEKRTKSISDDVGLAVKPVVINYAAGQTLVKAGELLAADQIKLLRAEYDATLAVRQPMQQITRGVAVLAMIFAGFVLCGVYMRHRQRGPLLSLVRLTTMLLLAILTVALACWAAHDPWQAEIIPLLLFGMTMAIAYRGELAVLLCFLLSLITAVAIGFGLPGFIMLMTVTTVANLNVARIRSRTKLIYLGLINGIVAALLYVALAAMENQPVGRPLLTDAARYGFWALAAGFGMSGLLPFIELIQLFGVLTDLSLLELSDVTHPLLQELVRRAPSTYNHSITVGSIAESAAESIGAWGLLVRVGAYFHDIGKMLKPGYFIENQGSDSNLHESLVPAMSTLVIIAHIKDGSDLARQHHLPQPIIDLIAQHHGTTLVEFFYDRAHEQMQSNPNGSNVDENTFRYPGPKPQTKEAAVLMLADAVESASRTLVDPAPARIESMVREIAELRLHGGQFDESGLTLRELRTIEKSMVMSLISIYHGRIKYPEQKTA